MVDRWIHVYLILCILLFVPQNIYAKTDFSTSHSSVKLHKKTSCVLCTHRKPSPPYLAHLGSTQRWVKNLTLPSNHQVLRAHKRLLQLGVKAFPQLIRALLSPHLHVRKRIVRLLKKSPKAALRQLQKRLYIRSNRIRESALIGIGMLQKRLSSSLRARIRYHLRRGPWYVRGAAAYALMQTAHSKTAVPTLLRALRDRSWRVKSNAAFGLLRLQGKMKQPIHTLLQKAKRHKETWARIFATTLLTSSKTRHHPLPRSSKTRLRVMTYNICHGEGNDGNYSLQRIAQIIRKSQAEIIALQEVDERTRRVRGVSQHKILARLTGYNSVFGAAIPFQGGYYGNAILSKYPIQHTRRILLPKGDGMEHRSVLRVRIRLPKRFPTRTLDVFSTHLDNQSAQTRKVAAQRINQMVKNSRHPALLLGDLNAAPQSTTLRTLRKVWKNSTQKKTQKTMPSTVPIAQIDYILYTQPTHWRTSYVHAILGPLTTMASDHLPLVADMQWISGAH